MKLLARIEISSKDSKTVTPVDKLFNDIYSLSSLSWRVGSLSISRQKYKKASAI